jgi:hypothetical protein
MFQIIKWTGIGWLGFPPARRLETALPLVRTDQGVILVDRHDEHLRIQVGDLGLADSVE